MPGTVLAREGVRPRHNPRSPSSRTTWDTTIDIRSLDGRSIPPTLMRGLCASEGGGVLAMYWWSSFCLLLLPRGFAELLAIPWSNSELDAGLNDWLANSGAGFNFVGRFAGSWRRVLTRSKGWNRTVEQKPETEPERNDFNTGCAFSLKWEVKRTNQNSTCENNCSGALT